MRRVITLGAMLPMVALGADWELNPRVEAGYLFDDNYRLTAPGSEIEVQGPLLGADARRETELASRPASSVSRRASAPRISRTSRISTPSITSARSTGDTRASA